MKYFTFLCISFTTITLLGTQAKQAKHPAPKEHPALARVKSPLVAEVRHPKGNKAYQNVLKPK